jgi:N-dimethylarginine dimethylaminohydrolase
MKANAIVDRKKAMNEWQALKRSIELEGVQVLTMDQVEGLPDMVFACNSGKPKDIYNIIHQ